LTALAQTIGRRSTAQASAATDVVLVVGASLFMALLAQLTIKLPFTPVPISGQTLGALLIGGTLGALRGGAALGLYLAWGAVGLPFFAEGKSGLEVLGFATASGGYLWGMLLAAVVIGWLAQKGWDRSLGSAIGAMLIGEIIIFTFGVIWLSQALDIPIVGSAEAMDDALDFGLYPFVIGDILKVLIAAAALPAAWRLAGHDKTFKR
jgi:biotin transport system substrate-specific component